MLRAHHYGENLKCSKMLLVKKEKMKYQYFSKLSHKIVLICNFNLIRRFSVHTRKCSSQTSYQHASVTMSYSALFMMVFKTLGNSTGCGWEGVFS